MSVQVVCTLPTGKTRCCGLLAAGATASALAHELASLEGIPALSQRLVCEGRELRPSALLTAGAAVLVHLRLSGGGGDGDQPDWTERGKVVTSYKRRGPEARAPDWHADPEKYRAKKEREKLERGELVVAFGPFCVPCGKRFAKQSVYDAHLSGSKHLKALRRMGRAEEAMVCQLDVEAKRRKTEALEAARDAERTGRTGGASGANDEAEAARRAARQEKLRERAMIPMPVTVAANGLTMLENPEASQGLTLVAERPADGALLAIEGSGTSTRSPLAEQCGPGETAGERTDLVAMHHAMAVAPSDWFNPSTGGRAPPDCERKS